MRTILLVEDEEMVRRLVGAVLRMSGYHVLEAANGADGLALSAGHDGSIELLLTDVMMPVMGGFELAVHMWRQRPATPALFMSGYNEEAQKLSSMDSEGRRTAGWDSIQKPFTPSELVQKIDELLEAHACGDQT